jgi:glycosyltransferase involved in cell wall biosynthesis
MAKKEIIILTPVYNDWHSFFHLASEINNCMQDLEDVCLHIIAVDDGSTQSPLWRRSELAKFSHIHNINILHLARNLGHQKAIALGLAYINCHVKNDYVIVMDADGEDRPQDILKLLETSENNLDRVIFAQRAQRSEGLLFRSFYFLYKIFFGLLTGSSITFGNFSLIPGILLNRVVHLPEIWNHFAAGIMRANIPLSSIPTKRGSRYVGTSSMNFVALVVHGLSAISVYIEILTVRLMLTAILIIAISILSFFVLLYVKYLTPLAIPGWATNVAIGIVIIMFQAILLLALLAFLSLNYRSSKLFIPAKDYQDYVLDLEPIYVN